MSTSVEAPKFYCYQGSVLIREETSNIYEKWDGEKWTPIKEVAGPMQSSCQITENDAARIISDLSDIPVGMDKARFRLFAIKK